MTTELLMSKLSRCKCGARLLDCLEYRADIVSRLDSLSWDGVHVIESFMCELLALPHVFLLQSALTLCLVEYLRRK